jgi:hypothetical protein
MNNPFQLTRAADLNDEQIKELWVDPQSNLIRMLRPASKLPMLILGGRGSGKTHLLRYYSYPVQRRVYGAEGMLDQVRKDGYLGIHTRCMGLYANRFSAKRMSDIQWQTLFSFYVELWFGQLILNTAIEFMQDSGQFGTFDEAQVTEKLTGLFDVAIESDVVGIAAFADFLRNLQRDLDSKVNMASFRQPITPQYIVTPGRLTFGIAQVLESHIPCLSGIQFTLFIDEYEHLYAEQQKNINTLIRERENPVSFKVGARLHGMRTYQTWGGDEELKEGSDYELLNLDAELRKKDAQYIEFASQLCISRIRFELGHLPEGWNDSNASEFFARTFEESSPISELVKNQLESKPGQRSPWIQNVYSSLTNNLSGLAKLGVRGPDDIEYITNKLAFGQDALIEKTSTFLFYGEWQNQSDLVKSAKSISDSADLYYSKKSVDCLHAKKLRHFREDMRDQMLADLKLDKNVGPNGLMSRYLGFETWTRMSDGIIRNLITTLKHVYDWALFKAEDIYAPSGISLKSQNQGIQDASRWFVSDANVLEVDRGMVETGIKRVSTLLRKIRFSAKPSECSLCRFSVNLTAIDPRARVIIEAAEMWSLLIRDSDRKQRNPGEQLTVLRINPLVAPDYYLPISARGNIDLNPSECLAIFGNQEESSFKALERERTGRCNPPFTKRQNSDNSKDDELNLF